MPDERPPPPSVTGLAVQAGVTGTELTPDKGIEPVWGEVIAKGPDADLPWHFQWQQVILDRTGKWRRMIDLPTVDGAYGSTVQPAKEGRPTVLLNPAVSMNKHDVPLGSIVRLTPSQIVIGPQEELHRFWTFELDELRAFRLVQDLIPTGGGELDKTIGAEWLDDLGPTITLYPNHIRGWPAGDEFFSLGIGRLGTKGWATYVPKATIIGVDAEGKPIWRAEWQIVTLDAKMVADLSNSGAVSTLDNSLLDKLKDIALFVCQLFHL